jgi:predicted secreted hydrolase
MPQPNPTNAKKKKGAQPADWPANGAIDLALHDLPHSSSTLESWHLNCHLATLNGRHFSLFASFTNTIIGKDEQTGDALYALSVNWALTDTDKQQYHHHSHADRADALVSRERLQLVIDQNSFQKIQEGKYQLKLHNALTGVACELNFMPFVNPVLHGDNGLITGTGGENLFYYFIPACEVNGTITLPGEEPFEVEGCGWYDHQFGKPKTARAKKQQLSLNWFTIQLENSWQITVYELFNTNKQPALFESDKQGAARWGVLIDPDGNAAPLADFQLTPGDTWTSARTLIAYPVQWRLTIAEYYIDIDIHAPLPGQEFITVVGNQAFWKGRIQIAGRFGKRTVNGLGYGERKTRNAERGTLNAERGTLNAEG